MTAAGSLPLYCRRLPTPRIGVSACLAGHAVRYDGTDKYLPMIDACIAPHAELLPLCPEAGLGTPRPPIHLQQTAQGVRAIGVTDPARDVTSHLRAFNEAQRNSIAGLCGIILKARSPSCGPGNTPVITAQGDTVPGDGIFAGFIRQHFPCLPVCDEAGINTEQQCHEFLQKVRLFNDARQAIADHALDAFLAHHKTHAALADAVSCYRSSLLLYLQERRNLHDGMPASMG